MSISYFDDKTKKPTGVDLAKALGSKYQLWETIQKHIQENYCATVAEWKFYSQKYGWSMKLLLKKRNLFFFGPRDGYFIIAFVFGDKTVSALEKSSLPKEIIDEVVNARKYVEGRGLRIEIKKKKDVENILKLIEIKVAN